MRVTRYVLATMAALFFACTGGALYTTRVSGSVEGVSFRRPIALVDDVRHPSVLLLTDDHAACDHLEGTGPLTPSAVVVGGHRQPALIVTRRTAYLDVGNHSVPLSGLGPEIRLEASQSDFEPDEEGEWHGGFSAAFERGGFGGEYAASECRHLQAGCTSAAGSPWPWALVVLASAWSRPRRPFTTD